MFDRRSSRMAFPAIAVLLTTAATTAAHSMATQEALASASSSPAGLQDRRRVPSSELFLPGLPGEAELRRTQPAALIGAIWVFGAKKGTW